LQTKYSSAMKKYSFLSVLEASSIRTFTFLILAGLPFLLFSCASTNLTENITGYDNDMAYNGGGISWEETKIVPLESKPECMLTAPQKLEMADSLFYILDNNRVLQFDKSGKYIRQIGQKGHGRQEYLNVGTFYTDADRNITLIDTYKNALLQYHSDGTFIESRTLQDGILQNAQCAYIDKGGDIYMYNYLYDDSHTLIDRIKKGDMGKTEVASTPMKTNNSKEKIGTHPISICDNKIKYILPFDNKIYSTDDSPVIEIETKQKIMNDAELSEIDDYSIMTYSNHLNDNTFLGFTDIFETPRFIMLGCSNLYYTIVDKKLNQCQRYSYSVGDEYKSLPLYNILSSSEDWLIGVIHPNTLYDIKIQGDDKIAQAITTYKKSIDGSSNYYIVMYKIKAE